MKCEGSLLRLIVRIQSTHHERASTTAEDLQPGCSSVGRVLALEARCRRFESCHPDQSTIATLAILTPYKGRCRSGNGRGCNPRACKFIGGSIPSRPTTQAQPGKTAIRWPHKPEIQGSTPWAATKQRAVGETVNATPSKGGHCRFDSCTAYQDLPRWRNGIRAGLRNQIFGVRVPGGAPSKRAAPRRAQSGLENRGIRKGDGSIPSPPAKWSVAREAMGRLAKPQPVGNRREGSIPSRSASHNTPNARAEPDPTAPPN